MNFGYEWIRQMRAGADVERAHIFPHVGTYSVGRHSFDVAMLIIAFYKGDPPKNVLLAALYHDLPEVWTGDVPAMTKRRLKALEETGLDDMEREFHEKWNTHLNLDEDEKFFLKLADRMELMVYCLDQRLLGNQNVDLVFHRVLDMLKSSGEIFRAPRHVSEIFYSLLDEYQNVRSDKGVDFYF